MRRNKQIYFRWTSVFLLLRKYDAWWARVGEINNYDVFVTDRGGCAILFEQGLFRWLTGRVFLLSAVNSITMIVPIISVMSRGMSYWN